MYKTCFHAVVRLGHVIRCIGLTMDLINLLCGAQMDHGASPEAVDALVKGVALKVEAADTT